MSMWLRPPLTWTKWGPHLEWSSVTNPKLCGDCGTPPTSSWTSLTVKTSLCRLLTQVSREISQWKYLIYLYSVFQEITDTVRQPLNNVFPAHCLKFTNKFEYVATIDSNLTDTYCIVTTKYVTTVTHKYKNIVTYKYVTTVTYKYVTTVTCNRCYT